MIELPIVVLSFGDYSSGKIYAAENAQGATILPVFTDGEVAQQYILRHSELVRLATLPISASRVVDYKSVSPGLGELCCSVLTSVSAVEDVLRLAGVSYGHFYVTLNPPESDQRPVVCYDVEEFIGLLSGS